MKPEELKAALRAKGWAEDRFGHMKKTSRGVISGDPVELRVKFQSISVRLERQVKIGDRNEWFKMSSCYLRDVKISDDGKLIIGSKVLK